jgi:transcriptional regulator with XRE-family HTH domain
MRNKSVSETGYNKFVGQRLKELRIHIGKSLEYVSSVLGCSRENYYSIEKGDTSISTYNLKLLADFYNLSIDLILSHNLIVDYPVTRFNAFKINEYGTLIPTTQYKLTNLYASMFIVERGKELLVMQSITSIVDNTLMAIEYQGNLILSKVYKPLGINDNKIVIEVDGSVRIVVKKEVYFFGYLVARINKIDTGHVMFFTQD